MIDEQHILCLLKGSTESGLLLYCHQDLHSMSAYVLGNWITECSQNIINCMLSWGSIELSVVLRMFRMSDGLLQLILELEYFI